MKRCSRADRAVLRAGCGEKAEPTGDAPGAQEPFTVMFDYIPNADHAGSTRRRPPACTRRPGSTSSSRPRRTRRRR